MRRIDERGNALSVYIREVTPNQLRQIADRLDAQALNNAQRGQVISYRPFENELWVFQPEPAPMHAQIESELV